METSDKILFPFHVMLIGFMGTGKTTISKELGQLIGLEEVDTDYLIVKNEGKSIPDIFEEFGEDYFRQCESDVVKQLQNSKSLIVSCGGGIVLRNENVQNMKKSGKIVLLTATPETIYHRVKDGTDRPILNNNMNPQFISDLLDKRKDKYLAAADIIISTDGKNVKEIAKEIVSKLQEEIN